MPPVPPPHAARADAASGGEVLVVRLSGDWAITRPRPTWPEVLAGRQPKKVVLQAGELGQWDSA
ncbi:MAG TPA: ABC transporter permease, partial [Lacunisphaera sp.]|nr:ABC transporter permease [Lacunisphaera sp.]